MSERPATPSVPPPPAPVAVSLPSILGYESLELLGSGGMGLVYKARQVSLKRLVALKMLHSAVQRGSTEWARFCREAEAVARLQHPNIVQIHEVGEHHGRPFFCFELVEGGSLAQRLTGTSLPARPAAQLIETLARAIHFAHRQGVVHRDLKPANILLASAEREPSEDGTSSGGSRPPLAEWVPKITDFGLAKQLDADVQQTQSGAILGTPSYMAPEQAEGAVKKIGPATDVYALGTILYELLTGQTPFKGSTTLDTLEQICSNQPAPPSRLQPNVHRDLEAICLKCLQKEPANRYPSAEALAEDLHQYLVGEPVRARPGGAWERGIRWARRRAAAAALLGVAILIVGALLAGLWKYSAEVQELNRKLQGATEQVGQERDATVRAKAEAEQQQVLAQVQSDRSRRSLFCLQLQQIAGAWETNPDAARELLDDPERCPPALRDFSWRFFDRLCKPDGRAVAAAQGGARGMERALLKGHTGKVYALAFSPDGRTLATASGDSEKPLNQGELKLWEAATGKELATLQSQLGGFYSLAYSPNGPTLGSGSALGQLTLWNTVTQKETVAVLAHVGVVRALAYSPDGRVLASAGIDKMIKLWDVASATVRATLSGHTNWVTSIAFSPDGRLLASGSSDRTVKLWDLPTGRERATLRGHTDRVFGVAFSPDSKTVASACFDKTIRLWDVGSGRQRAVFRGGARIFKAVAFSPDGKTLAVGGWTSEGGKARSVLELWDPEIGQLRATLKGHTTGLNSLVFAPHGNTLATASGDGTIRLWEAAAERAPVR